MALTFFPSGHPLLPPAITLERNRKMFNTELMIFWDHEKYPLIRKILCFRNLVDLNDRSWRNICSLYRFGMNLKDQTM